MLMIWSSLARNRLPSLVASCFLGRIDRCGIESWRAARGNPRTKIARFQPLETPNLAIQNLRPRRKTSQTHLLGRSSRATNQWKTDGSGGWATNSRRPVGLSAILGTVIVALRPEPNLTRIARFGCPDTGGRWPPPIKSAPRAGKRPWRQFVGGARSEFSPGPYYLERRIVALPPGYRIVPWSWWVATR